MDPFFLEWTLELKQLPGGYFQSFVKNNRLPIALILSAKSSVFSILVICTSSTTDSTVSAETRINFASSVPWSD